MAIDTSGKWWKGSEFADLAEYIRIYTSEGYPATVIKRSTCEKCGGTLFWLHGDQDEGCAKRVCVNCKTAAFIADSDEYWEEAEPHQCVCPCKGRHFELAVGFSFREDGNVRWITVGERCVKCGTLGIFVEWKIDYGPTQHLLNTA